MGKAIIIPGIDFSNISLGRVTLQGNTPLQALNISGPAQVSGGANAATFLPTYTPINTTQRGVSWSIVSGGSYASIDASTGVLSVLPGATARNVTIRATSTDNPTITADKTISVTYIDGSVVFKNTIKFDGLSAIDTGINASMPTEIQVTLASVNIADWGNISSETKTSVLIGGRVSSSSMRRDIQLQSYNSSGFQTINSIIFGVGNVSKNVEGLSLSQSAELYIAQGPTYYRYNGTTIARTAQDTFNSSVHYVIGAQNNNGTLQFTYASHDKFKRVKIFATEGGTLLGDFVPAEKNGVPGMYDNVSNTFFTNVGSGTLIVE